MTTERRVLELALLALEGESSRIQQEMSDIRKRLGRAGAISGSHSTRRAAPNKGKKMSAAQKRAISRTMKARWAERKKSK
jgi:hypothetical protein